MNKTALVSIIVVILIILIGGYFIFLNGSQGSMYSTVTNTNSSATNTPNNTPPVITNPQPQNLNSSVSIKNFAFNPTPLIVKIGTHITWTNNDSAPHQLKSDTFNSAILTNGQTFSFKFTVPGQYDYSCAIHPSMHGQIIVTQ